MSGSSTGIVLIADDDEVSRVVAKAMLAKRGYRAALACDGREAVDMARADRYAAILMDCEMPGLDGYEATAAIRAAESGSHVPIIAMTAYADTSSRERCLAAGMDDYLLKPFEPEQLDTVIATWLNQATHWPEQDVGTSDSLLDQRAISQLRNLLADDVRHDLLATFEASVARCLADLQDAFDRGDGVELRRVAHLLKGSATTLAATRLGNVCAEMERTGRDDVALDELRAVTAESLSALRVSLL